MAGSGELARVDASFRAMGTCFELVLYHEDERLLRALINDIQEEVARLEAKLSRFRPTSEVSRLNRLAGKQAVQVDFEMAEILSLALEYYAKTEGAFDITVAPLVREWGFYDRRPHLADAVKLREMLERVGSEKIELDQATRKVRFLHPELEIDLGALGKGYALREVVALVRRLGVKQGLLSFGGSSIYGLGDRPGHSGWTFGFRYDEDPATPPGTVTLRDMAFSMSGSTVRRFRKDGRTYGHVLDPRSGSPVEEVKAVAVVHRDPAIAEILSTACMVRGVNGSEALLRAEKAQAIFALQSPEGPVLREVNFLEVKEEWRDQHTPVEIS
ncbi:MAG: FAD:protein FMN transferase [candidate division KSB1 bacterium]|nr:FAD:protein FMN transferase [candidate division KSB1 bacterium]